MNTQTENKWNSLTDSEKFEALAARLAKTIWAKGDMKRIYMNDVGYNTKKMSTKAFIFQLNGEFKVSVTVECPSQTRQWCKSQEDEIKGYIYNRIDDAINREDE